MQHSEMLILPASPLFISAKNKFIPMQIFLLFHSWDKVVPRIYGNQKKKKKYADLVLK